MQRARQKNPFNGVKHLNCVLTNVEGSAYNQYTVELQRLEHLWHRENMFETGVVQPNERRS